MYAHYFQPQFPTGHAQTDRWLHSLWRHHHFLPVPKDARSIYLEWMSSKVRDAINSNPSMGVSPFDQPENNESVSACLMTTTTTQYQLDNKIPDR
jgi:hypothetical protein